MGIFTGTETLFFMLGALTVVLVCVLKYLARKYPFKWHSTILACSGIFMILFAIAWSISSMLKGEARAAGMGLFIFGFMGVILFALTRTLVAKEMKAVTK